MARTSGTNRWSAAARTHRRGDRSGHREGWPGYRVPAAGASRRSAGSTARDVSPSARRGSRRRKSRSIAGRVLSLSRAGLTWAAESSQHGNAPRTNGRSVWALSLATDAKRRPLRETSPAFELPRVREGALSWTFSSRERQPRRVICVPARLLPRHASQCEIQRQIIRARRRAVANAEDDAYPIAALISGAASRDPSRRRPSRSAGPSRTAGPTGC